MKPRVFVSHGAGDDEAVWALVEAIEKRLEGDFQVFLDRERIHAGQDWRGELDRELTTCHCGVAVTSKRSLERPEVRREVDFLLLRAREPGFVLVAALADVDMAAAAAKGARGLDALDIVALPDPEVAAGEVADGLAPVLAARLDDRELRWKAPLRARLRNAERAALEDAAACLGRDVDVWPWVVDPPGAVAQWMLQCGDVAALFAATEALHNADPTVDAAAVFATALPHAWIDWDAACYVRRAIDARPAVAAVDTLRTETGEMYVRRTVWGPKVEQLTNVAGEDDAELLAEAELALRRILGDPDLTKQEIKDELADPSNTTRPVLVLPFEPPGREAVREVLDEFPGVALVFCVGPRTAWLHEEGDVARTQPGLDTEKEQFVLRKYKVARRFARSG